MDMSQIASDSSPSLLSSLSSAFRPMLEFMYENITYIFGFIVIIFGILVYIHMADVTFEMPMTRTKTLIIEGMEHKMDHDDSNGNSENGNGAMHENTLLTLPIDLEKKLKSNFCNMHAKKGSSATDIDNECKVFGKASCLHADCCGWVVTAENPDGMCRSGSQTGMTFGYDGAGKKIDVDCYYYKDSKSGPRCPSS